LSGFYYEVISSVDYIDVFAAGEGLENLDASIATFGWTFVILVVDRPPTHSATILKGILIRDQVPWAVEKLLNCGVRGNFVSEPNSLTP